MVRLAILSTRLHYCSNITARESLQKLLDKSHIFLFSHEIPYEASYIEFLTSIRAPHSIPNTSANHCFQALAFGTCQS